ncbi:hypothetical protein ANN_10879 [Periplaneta americana]|uniref:Uncharacterized protein n=1 Tax=Periplaneta americana TaxID=6978 RepID=A0ABQ8T5S8_PERAM|nr:hypothetical protein ANN_10879 [Periplaneta americana]
MECLIMPPKKTKYFQPLDIYFLRQYYARSIADCIRTLAENPELNLGNRVFIMKMHSVIHNQLSAPVYRPMLQYSWQSACYVNPEQVLDFKNVIQVAFDFSALECDSEDCLDNDFRILVASTLEVVTWGEAIACSAPCDSPRTALSRIFRLQQITQGTFEVWKLLIKITLLEACGRETSPYRTVARWAHAFRNGMEDVHQKHGAGRPQSASDDVHVNAVRALLKEYRCWTCVELAREVGIAPGTIE